VWCGSRREGASTINKPIGGQAKKKRKLDNVGRQKSTGLEGHASRWCGMGEGGKKKGTKANLKAEKGTKAEKGPEEKGGESQLSKKNQNRGAIANSNWGTRAA